MTKRVFVDANIFFSKTLMDWMFLLRYSNEGIFQLHTSEDVIAEVLANMRAKSPMAPGHYTRRRAELIRLNLDEVVSNFSPTSTFTGKDIHDYHIHAAASSCNADILLTQNHPSDITQAPEKEYYEILNADQFFTLVVDNNPHSLWAPLKEQLKYHRNSRKSLSESLANAGCPVFSLRVEWATGYVKRNGHRMIF